MQTDNLERYRDLALHFIYYQSQYDDDMEEDCLGKLEALWAQMTEAERKGSKLINAEIITLMDGM